MTGAIVGLGGGDMFSFPLNSSLLDSYLANCNALIVGIRRRSDPLNPKATHYIMVTGRVGNDYSIIDPAYPSITTLGATSIYQIIAYSIND